MSRVLITLPRVKLIKATLSLFETLFYIRFEYLYRINFTIYLQHIILTIYGLFHGNVAQSVSEGSIFQTVSLLIIVFLFDCTYIKSVAEGLVRLQVSHKIIYLNLKMKNIILKCHFTKTETVFSK